MYNHFWLIFSLLVSGGIFIGCLLYCSFRRQYLKAFLLGTLTFTCSQILLRIPLLQLASHVLPSYQLFLFSHPLFSGFFLALTAGLFEETGRWIAFHFLPKQRLIPKQALFFGIGHGGVEALIIVFPTILVNIGTNSIPAESLCLTSIERLSAITFHILLSLIVCLGVANNKKGFWFLAILLHTGGNFLITLVPFLGGSIIATEITLFFYVSCCYLLYFLIKKGFRRKIK